MSFLLYAVRTVATFIGFVYLGTWTVIGGIWLLYRLERRPQPERVTQITRAIR